MTLVPDCSEPFWFPRGQKRVQVPGKDTGRSISAMEFTAPSGHARPMHVHDDENELGSSWTDKVTFFVGDRCFDLEPGQAAHGPRGVAATIEGWFVATNPRSRRSTDSWPPSTSAP